MITRRSWLIYGMLIAIWAVLIAWQVAEHAVARRSYQNLVVDRGRSITTTCGLLMRARSYFGVVSRERLETALNELVDTNELLAVELLNTNGDVVASAGQPFEIPPKKEFDGGILWSAQEVIVENPVDLGTNVPQLILPREEMRLLETNRLGGSTNPPTNLRTNDLAGTNGVGTNAPSRRRFGEYRRPGRPYWMKEEEYRALIERKGAHTFVIVMSTELAHRAIVNDSWMRLVIGFLGTLAVAGFGMAWRSQEKTAELQVRLVRASELNLHLKELNLAAAGLAHETRNPLNIIRGLAQLIGKQQNVSEETQTKSREIMSETDRLTAQLNEFINYSRPREVRRAPVDLSAVCTELVRTLTFDIEEKKIQVEIHVEPLTIEADEQLLRQALFNLVLNAIEALQEGGMIRLCASRGPNEEAFLEISDNGPGVAAENRAEIFKPYFTTHAEGTGLGLAVVQQIVLAHGWEITCEANKPKGALFRIAHIKTKG